MSDTDRYLAAAHAMQTGIASLIHYDKKLVEPKHLRVGIDSAHVSDAALVNLLIDKKVFTREEFEKYLANAMEAEVKRTQTQLEDLIGTKVTLI